MLKEIGVFKIPTYAVTALEYGDSSALETLDVDNINDWLELEFSGCSGLVFDWSNGKGRATDDGDPNEAYFTSDPAFGLPMDCIDCLVLGHQA